MMSYEDVIWSDGRSFPDIIGTWIQGTSINDIGDFGEKCSPLFLGEGLILASSVETLSHRLNESFDDPILVTCVWCIPFPFEITTEIL